MKASPDHIDSFKAFRDPKQLAAIEADLKYKIENNIDDQEVKSKHKETRRDLREKKKQQKYIDKI